jgi:hypothetical protein
MGEVIWKIVSRVSTVFSPRMARGWIVAGWLAVVLILAVAAWQRVRLPPIAVADPDSWGYLSPALTLPSSGQFVQNNGRDWFYSALIWVGLESSGSMAGLVRFQQTLGLLSGVLMAMCWRLWAQFLPGSAGREAGVAVFGAMTLALYLWRPDSLVFEMQLRPESVWCFFIFLQLVFLLAYCRARWVHHCYGAAFWHALAVFPLAYVNVLLKPSWGLAWVVTVLPVFIGIFGARKGLIIRMLAPAAALALTVLVLWLPVRAVFSRDQMGPARLPLALFTIHAKWILKNFEEKASTLPVDSEEGRFLSRFLPVFREEFAHTMDEDSVYRQLGYDADYLRYRSPIFKWLNEEEGIADKRLLAFCYESYFETLRSQPGGMAGKIWRQFRLFLLPEDATFYKRGTNYRDKYQVTVERLPEQPPGLSENMKHLYGDFRAEAARASTMAAPVEPWRLMQRLAIGVAFLVPIVLFLFVILLVICLSRPVLGDLRLAGLTALMLYAAPAANALTVSVVHALDVSRYRLSYAGPLLLGLAALALFDLMAIARLFGPRRSNPDIGALKPLRRIEGNSV